MFITVFCFVLFLYLLKFGVPGKCLLMLTLVPILV